MKKNNQGKNLNRKKITLITILVIFVLLLAVLGTIYEKNTKFRDTLDKYIFLKEKHENNLPQISINSDTELNVYAFNNKILLLENNQLIIYNQNGNEEETLDIEISNPIFKSSGDYLCIAEKGGKKVYVISNKNLIWQKDLEGSISDIEINSNGYVAALLSGTIYKTIIQTFDSKGAELFKTYLSSTYVIDMEFSQDNKYLAIAEVNLSGILIQSNIKIISVEKAKKGDIDSIVYAYSGESGDLIINLEYQNKNELVCVFDNHVEVIKNDNHNNLLNLEENVLFIELNNKVVSIIKENSQTYLQIIDPNTNDAKCYEILEPKKIYAYDNVIALNMGSEILFYNNSGWLIKKYSANQEVNKIVICNNLAGIIYNNKIELISL